MYRCRWARPGERAILYAIWEQAVRATHHFVSREDLALYGDLIRREYLPAGPIRVAVDEADTPLGFLRADGAMIEMLFVRPDQFGRGIGRLLVAEVLAGGEPVRVDVNEQNAGARRFYERLGFAAIGRSPVDACGRPYPLVHLRHPGLAAGCPR